MTLIEHALKNPTGGGRDSGSAFTRRSLKLAARHVGGVSQGSSHWRLMFDQLPQRESPTTLQGETS